MLVHNDTSENLQDDDDAAAAAPPCRDMPVYAALFTPPAPPPCRRCRRFSALGAYYDIELR